MLLTEENYEVLGFGSVGEFFGNITNHEVDLFLLDVRLPDGNGMEVCTAIKSAQLTKDIPVLMMSAHSTIDEVQSTCMAEGFIEKPFDIYGLLEKISHTIQS